MSDLIISEKCAFIRQYVLNRALAHVGGLDSAQAFYEAEKVWDLMEKCSPTKTAEAAVN